MNFLEAFDAPIPIVVNGTEYKLPRLTIGDYLDWTSELTAQRREEATKLIPAGLPMAQRYLAARRIATEQATLDDIAALLYTPAGTQKVLRKSLAKLGIAGEAADKILAVIPASGAMTLAMEVSSLFAKNEQQAEAKQGEGKQGSDPSQNSPASTATG